MRNRVAWSAVGLCCMMVAGCGSVSTVLAPKATPADTTVAHAIQSCPRVVHGQGMIAFAARGKVKLVHLATCRTRALADINATDLRFSPDGRWLAYSRQAGYAGTALAPSSGVFVVPVHGGPVRAPLGTGVRAWSWAPNRDRLYGITAAGSLVSASPTGQRRVVTTGLGRVTLPGFGLSSDGDWAVVDRSRCSPPAVGELDLIDLRTGARTVTLTAPGKPVVFAGFSPDGRWLLFWSDKQCSASIAADGLPLDAVPVTGGKPITAVKHMLLFHDFLSWCGQRLIAAAGSDRETNTGSELVRTGPPVWRQRTIRHARPLSWVSPSCTRSGRLLAAAAGPSNTPAGFGREHRSIWLLRSDGVPIRRLTSPPMPRLSDEAPRFSADRQWVMFVRTRVVPVGSLSAISKDTIELLQANGTGSDIPIVRFTSSDFSYYDHFDWPDEIAWYQPATGARASRSRCSTSELRLTNDPHQISEQTQQETRLLVLRNASQITCTLRGRPTVSLLDRHGVRLPFAYHDAGDQMLTHAHPAVVVLHPGKAAYVAINKNACVGRSRATAARLLLTLAGSHRALKLRLHPYPLLDYCGRRDPGHRIDISPFEPLVAAVFDR